MSEPAQAKTSQLDSQQPSLEGVFARLLAYARPYRSQIIKALLLLLLATGLQLSGPLLIKVFIDDHLTASHYPWWPLALLFTAYVSGQLLSAFAFYRQSLAFNSVALSVVETLRLEVFAKVLRLPLAFFDRTANGSLLSRITNDSEAVKELYINIISLFLQNSVKVLGILLAMAILDWQLMLVALLLIPAVLTLMFAYQRLSTPVFQRVRSLLSDINARINESIQGMSLIQQFRQQARFQQQFSELSHGHWRTRMRNLLIDGLLLRALVDFLYLLLLIALLQRFGVQALTLEGAVQIGVLYAFLTYLGSMTEPIIEMVSRLNLLQQSLVSAQRVFVLMDEPEQAASLAEGVAYQPPKDASLLFAIDEFAYQPGRPVLSQIQLRVPAGAFIGIVGHTGSGKSTLMSLLMSFYPISKGQILLGGQALTQLPASERSAWLGLVQQDPFIYRGSIRDNIALELPLSQQQIEQAAKQAQLHEAIMAMPEGYHTQLAERGANLSTGQRQLLSLARTLARQPKILILDEATSNIDSHTERLLQQSLAQLRGQMTIIAIAHRLSTVQDADQLWVLHQGQVQQQGSHQQLLAEDGLYRHLYQMQQQEQQVAL